MAEVLDCADVAAGEGKDFDDIVCKEFYKTTPWGFLSKYAMNDSGAFDLGIIHDPIIFKWACVAANLVVRESGLPNVDGCRIRINSKWNLKNFENQLRSYQNKQVVELLRYGFPIECDEKIGTYAVPENHRGTTEFEVKVSEYLSKQINNKTLIGPFKVNPFGEHARFSPLNTVEKRDSMDRRVILDLSWLLDGMSVNDGINKDWYRGKPVKCELPSVWDLVKLVQEKGRYCLIFKKDLKNAYKQIGICLSQIHVLGFVFKGLFYFDITLPMGLKNSALICQMVTNVIMHVFRAEGYNGINYLDDLGAAEFAALAEQANAVLAQILQDLGVVEAVEKAVEPSMWVVFLGILINTFLMRLEISKDRMAEILADGKNIALPQTSFAGGKHGTVPVCCTGEAANRSIGPVRPRVSLSIPASP